MSLGPRIFCGSCYTKPSDISKIKTKLRHLERRLKLIQSQVEVETDDKETTQSDRPMSELAGPTSIQLLPNSESNNSICIIFMPKSGKSGLNETKKGKMVQLMGPLSDHDVEAIVGKLVKEVSIRATSPKTKAKPSERTNKSGSSTSRRTYESSAGEDDKAQFERPIDDSKATGPSETDEDMRTEERTNTETSRIHTEQ